MAYNKHDRPSAKRHNFLMDKMTEANLKLLLTNDELMSDNIKIINDWGIERKAHAHRIDTLNNTIAAMLLREEELLLKIKSC